MIRFIKASCTIAVVFVGPLALACDYPERVSIPNGNTATKDEMVAGQRGVKQYMADMEAYLACIEEEDEIDRAGIEEPDPIVEAQRDEMLVKKHNAAVEEMEKIAAAFNEEVRAYKARSD
jgi:rhamnose utilization protein RhaD (predicted bifunctional aldolase and dehydrogenase)